MSSKTKKQQIKDTQATATLAFAEAINIEASLAALATANIETAQDLAKVQERLVAKYNEMKALEEAIRLKKDEMKMLHGADSILLSIDELNAQLVLKRAEVQREIDDLHEDYERRAAKLAEEHRRQEEHYLYALNKQRKEEEDAWNEEQRQRTLIERERAQLLEKSWKEREEALALKENIFHDAVAKAEAFDSELKKEVDKQTAIVANTLKKDFEHQRQITEVNHRAEVHALTRDAQHLREVLQAKDGEIASLTTQLARAIQAQTELAKATVDAAANQKAQAEAMATFTAVAGGNGQRTRA